MGRSDRTVVQTRERVGAPASLSLENRNGILLDAIVDIVGLTKGKQWDDVRRELSEDHVRQIYKVVAWLWPPDVDIEQMLPKPGGSLRALYLGTARPEVILNNVVRYSLYSDEILVINPFLNPWCIAKEYNPLAHPDQFLADTLRLILFMVLLEPWIRSGIVRLIPDPGDFDYELRARTWKLARERLKDWTPTREDTEDLEPTARQDFERLLLRFPKEFHRKKLREAVPGITDREVDEALKFIDELRRKDPLTLDQSVQGAGSELQIFRTGANLEMGMFIAQATGAFPYTDIRHRWKELLSVAQQLPGGSQTWTPLTHDFQQLEFKFLDGVDPNFAHRLREEGRLESFRRFLRKIWQTVNAEPTGSDRTSVARSFSDELHGEFAQARAEWDKIDHDLLKWTGGTLAGAVAAGHFSLELPALGFCIAAVVELLSSRMRRGAFRQTVPMSVFIDLSRR